MARKFLVGIDLNKNELSNAVVQNLATAPSSPVAGQIYYNTSSNTVFFYNGTSWIDVYQSGSVISGTFASRPAAGTNNRLYYATDQQILYFDNGTAWSQVSNFGTVTAETSYGQASSNGTSNNYSRADHTHGTPSLTSNTPSTQAIGDAAVVGTGTTPARDDHKHAMPSFGAVTAQTSFGAASANGTGTSIARNDHTHGTPTHDNAAHSTINLSALATPTTAVSFNSQKITNLADPTNAQDGATKNYVDSVAQGLDVKASVRAATTTAGTLASSFANGSVVDGVTLATGNRILIKNQATGSENGIYTVNATGAPTRATDMDSAAEFPGAFTFVEEGTTNADTGWVCTNNAPVTVGTTAITFTQFSGAGTYTASNGVLLTGSNFTFNPTSTGGLQTAAGGASILKPTNSGLVTDATGLYVGAGTGITVSGTNVSLTNTSLTVNGTAISLGGSGTITANTTNALTLGTGLTGTSFNGSAAVTAAIDTSVVVRKFAANVGDGTSTAITVTHNLGTRDIQVTLYDNSSPYAELVCDVEHTTTNTATLRFSVAPTSNQYRVVVFA